MSQTYEIAVVPVCVSVDVPVQLADIMGRVPVKELTEVLEERCTVSQQWQRIQAGEVYHRAITEHVTLEVRISPQGQVTFQRATQVEQADTNVAAAVEAQHRVWMQEAAPAYSLAVNELISTAAMRAMTNTVKERELLIGEPIITQTAEYTEIVCHLTLEI